MTTHFLDTLKLIENIISSAIFLTYYKLGKAFHLCGGTHTNLQSQKPVSLNTRTIYNVLADKKKRTSSCIEKWSENYPGFHTAQKT